MIPTAHLGQGGSSSFRSDQLGKPEQFKGDQKDYADWSFVFKSYMSCVSTKFIQLFERIESSRVPLLNRMFDENDRAPSTQMYYVLAMLVEGRALDIIQNTGVGEGAEAFRKLEETYHPRIASRFVGSLSLILLNKIWFRYGS